MIYCSDNFTLIQLKKWITKAKKVKQDHKVIRDDFIGVITFGDELVKKDKVELYKTFTNSEKNTEWADKFLRYIDRWQYAPDDQGFIVKFFASERDLFDGFVSEFSFAVYGRSHSGGVQMFDADPDRSVLFLPSAIGRDKPFCYNGGFINSGSNEVPNWSSHT